MARWEPNARTRIEEAALSLFAERGYDATSVAEIADRAGLTKSAFFRYFSDKREVLLGGEDLLVELFSNAIRDALPTATAIDCLTAAISSAASVMTPERRKLVRQRQAVIAANSELQERALLKRSRLSSAIANALLERGTGTATALLAAEMGVLAFSFSVARWADTDNSEEFITLVSSTLGALQDGAAALAPSREPRG